MRKKKQAASDTEDEDDDILSDEDFAPKKVSLSANHAEHYAPCSHDILPNYEHNWHVAVEPWSCFQRSLSHAGLYG